MTISTLNMASHDEGGDWIVEEGHLTPLAPQVTIFCAVIYAHSIWPGSPQRRAGQAAAVLNIWKKRRKVSKNVQKHRRRPRRASNNSDSKGNMHDNYEL